MECHKGPSYVLPETQTFNLQHLDRGIMVKATLQPQNIVWLTQAQKFDNLKWTREKNSKLKEKSVTQEQNSRIRPILEFFSEEIMEKSRKKAMYLVTCIYNSNGFFFQKS